MSYVGGPFMYLSMVMVLLYSHHQLQVARSLHDMSWPVDHFCVPSAQSESLSLRLHPSAKLGLWRFANKARVK